MCHETVSLLVIFSLDNIFNSIGFTRQLHFQNSFLNFFTDLNLKFPSVTAHPFMISLTERIPSLEWAVS